MPSKINWTTAPEIKRAVNFLVEELEISWVKPDQIHCYRSVNSTTRASARIWGFPRLWQMALDLPPYYIIEVISERFDHLSKKQKDKILLHEIAHIPKNFSGALVPHTKKGKGNFHDKLKTIITAYNKI